jgi:hypothetical protein
MRRGPAGLRGQIPEQAWRAGSETPWSFWNCGHGRGGWGPVYQVFLWQPDKAFLSLAFASYTPARATQMSLWGCGKLPVLKQNYLHDLFQLLLVYVWVVVAVEVPSGRAGGSYCPVQASAVK